MTPLRLGTLAWPVGRPAGIDGYAARLDGFVAEAKGRADLLLMPEYAPMEIVGGEAGAAAELRAMVGIAPAVVEAMRGVARRHGVWLVPGSLPMESGGRVVNRAPLIAPDGRLAFQDKRMMTRFEAESWGVSAGAGPVVFGTPWGTIGVSICYDAEFPKHVRAQVEAGAWLVLVPACTDSLHGYNRVRFSAQARALENQCIVAVAPTVGLAPWSAALDENHGAASVHGPVDRGFPVDGVLTAGAMDAPGWVFCTLDPGAIERVRRDGAVLNHRDWPKGPVEPPALAVLA
ncbi:carbon-nitrogen hydrolase family protein [Belnapia sp. T18]|uniref:Carbon-nitrogen hydrolase family protein n=1 Tax=Belnapia arida TaxID=2804533 RepID=A0ABS1TXW8_9PROT|nr:carbon-nitrogen hydrolase family protein [Belnapia arida]MBL6077286.1 carbon-nitrogen hydrolase family protein [Belnapia arida]